jgi:hypothetical protein
MLSGARTSPSDVSTAALGRYDELLPATNDKRGSFTFHFPHTGNNYSFALPVNAVVDSVRWYVLEAGTGPDPRIYTSGAPVVTYVVKGDNTAFREQTLAAVVGAQTGDSLATLTPLGAGVTAWNFAYTGGAGTYPKGFVRIDYTVAAY